MRKRKTAGIAAAAALFLFLSFALTGGSFTAAAEGEQSKGGAFYAPGDINGDGKVTALDYIGIRLHILKLNVLEGEVFAAADVNGDGKITVTDYIAVRLHILGLSTLKSTVGQLLAPKEFETPRFASSLKSAAVEYEKRQGGRYIYCNNPEALQSADINVMLLKEKDLSGGYFFTFEHVNNTGKPIYLGFRVRNTGTKPVTVTVHNIGYQTQGDAFGKREWNDFYGFDFAAGTHSGAGVISGNDTYVVSPGKYIYVIGGTSADAYENTNVSQTADKMVAVGSIANGAVYFTVAGGSAEGQFFCYDTPEGVALVTEEQGYVTLRDGRDFSRQYKGSAPYIGVVDASFGWTVDDGVPDGAALPVRYTVTYASDARTYGYAAYEPYNIDVRDKEIISDTWHTHLSVNNEKTSVDTDMMPFYCVTPEGKEVVIDSYHADGKPYSANIGNWMIIYQEQYTFCNAGENTRAFALHMRPEREFVVALLIRDAKGNVQDSMLIDRGEGANPHFYSVNVEPGEYKQIMVEYVLLANSYGSIYHYVTVEKPDVWQGGGDETSSLVTPKLNLTDRQSASALTDLHIGWESQKGASSYTCIVLRLPGAPDPANERESALPGAATVYSDTGQSENFAHIPAAELTPGHWYKIAVAVKNDREERWKSIYVFIN